MLKPDRTTPHTARKRRRSILTRLAAVAATLSSVSCLRWAEEPELGEEAALDRLGYRGMPPPGRRVPFEGETLTRDVEIGAATEPGAGTGEENRAQPTVYALSGEVEAVGPFSAGDAADGKWLRVTDGMESWYVLLPGKLAVRSAGLKINKGGWISVRGYLRAGEDRRFMRAVAVRSDAGTVMQGGAGAPNTTDGGY